MADPSSPRGLAVLASSRPVRNPVYGACRSHASPSVSPACGPRRRSDLLSRRLRASAASTATRRLRSGTRASRFGCVTSAALARQLQSTRLRCARRANAWPRDLRSAWRQQCRARRGRQKSDLIDSVLTRGRAPRAESHAAPRLAPAGLRADADAAQACRSMGDSPCRARCPRTTRRTTRPTPSAPSCCWRARCGRTPWSGRRARAPPPRW